MNDNLDDIPPLVFSAARKLSDEQLRDISSEIYGAMNVDAEEEIKGIDPMFIISIVLAVLQACIANRMRRVREKLLQKAPGSLLHRRLAKNLRLRIQYTATGQGLSPQALNDVAKSMVLCFGDSDNDALVETALGECKE